jgi:uncharacterized FAD-dependent dehydrogenase
VSKGVDFKWEAKVYAIDFENERVLGKFLDKENHELEYRYDELIFAVGKSGIDFAQQLANEYELPDEPKSVQIGVRFEAPQEHFQNLIDISYDFKLYRKFDDKGVSISANQWNLSTGFKATIVIVKE